MIMAKKNDSFKEKLITMRTEESIKRRRWDLTDDQSLTSFFHEGLGISLIALKMNRTERAVCNRIQKLKPYPKKTKPREPK